MYNIMYKGSISESKEMATKIRKQIYLEPRQNKSLKRQAKAQGVSEAEIIRRKIDAPPSPEIHRKTNPAAFKIFLDLAKKRMAQGPISGGRRWKREELYEERLARYGKDLSARR